MKKIGVKVSRDDIERELVLKKRKVYVLKNKELRVEIIHVVATTYHKEQMISLTSKPQSGSIMWEFTRELDKESLLN